MNEGNTHAFRTRGIGVARTENFVDAAFAFAITLLVIGSAGIPGSIEALESALLRIPAFAVCVALLGIYWSSHHRYSRRFGLEDATTQRLSWVLVAVVLIYVYPLRAVMGLSLSYFSGGALPADFEVRSDRDLEIAFVIYAVGVIAMTLIVLSLNRHALRRADELDLSDYERFEVGIDIKRSWIALAIAGFSLASAVFLLMYAPARVGSLVGVPGFVYLILGIAMPAFSACARRARRRFGVGDKA